MRRKCSYKLKQDEKIWSFSAWSDWWEGWAVWKLKIEKKYVFGAGEKGEELQIEERQKLSSWLVQNDEEGVQFK